MRKSAFLLLLFGFLMQPIFAQKRNQKPVSFNKHYNEIFPHAPQFELNGWHFAPGATYMLARTLPKIEMLATDSFTTTEGKYSPIGKPAFYAEVGRYKVMKYSGLIKYIDYGISYKGLLGRHKSTISQSFVETDSVMSETEVVSKFGYHFLEAYVNANHVWRIRKYNFVQNSLGLNAGYAIIAKTENATIPLTTSNIPARYQFQLHYKLGFGIKMRGNWMIIPSVETPIITALPWDDGRSSMNFFTSRYRPLIFSLRFLFLRPVDTMKCTPVKTREGTLMPSDMEKQGQMNQR
jgi:hypothetical protein